MIPDGENIVETKTCRISGQEFAITDKDLEFYTKISPTFAGKVYQIPTPSLCPQERQRRRLSWRNDRQLYQRKCDFSGKQIISMYDSETPFPVYEQSIWWGDDWDRYSFSEDMNFDKPFFDSFKRLRDKTPRISMSSIGNENSDYALFSDYSKNCYLLHTGTHNEDCYYGSHNFHNRDCVDILWCRDCESCHNLTHCEGCHECFSCSYLKNSRNCYFSRNLSGCEYCIGCSNLKNKKYHFFNEEVTPQQFTERLEQIQNQGFEGKVEERQKSMTQSAPFRNLENIQTENCFGNHLMNCKDMFQCFDCRDSQNCKYSSYLIDTKDSMDWDCFGIESNHCYEMCSSAYKHVFSMCVLYNWQGSTHSYYCDMSQNISDCFGCVSLKKASNCILNKSYSKQEYETLCGKIADHMISTGEWGEFFPHEMSPFGYNETVAQEYFPLTKEEAQSNRWNWKDEDETTSFHGSFYQALPISQYDESIVGDQIARSNIEAATSGILQCEVTGKPFKVIKQELAFYIQNKLSLPTKCPDERHKDRMQMRNPRILYSRTCDQCQQNIDTTYNPDREQRIFCEECYRREVY